jgi:hypothetical protein
MDQNDYRPLGLDGRTYLVAKEAAEICEDCDGPEHDWDWECPCAWCQ